MSQYDPNNPYGQQPPPPPPPPPGPGPTDSGATTVFQPQQPAGGHPAPPGQPAGGYPAQPGGYPPAPGQQPPSGYPNQPPGYGQPPPGPSAGQRLQQLALSPQDWMILGATLVMLLGLFLNWQSFDGPGGDANGFDDGFFPVSFGFLVAALLGAVPIVLRLAKTSMPPFMGVGTREAEGVIGILMILGGLAWLIRDTGGADKGIGLWLTILAAFVWGAAAIWRNFAPATAGGGTGGPGAPGYGGY